jgi:hypothetical protein
MIEEMLSAVEVTAYIPSNSANAGAVSMPNVNGSMRASPTAPPRPGTAPIQIPMRMPRSKYIGEGQLKAIASPSSIASVMLRYSGAAVALRRSANIWGYRSVLANLIDVVV